MLSVMQIPFYTTPETFLIIFKTLRTDFKLTHSKFTLLNFV